MDVRNTRPAPDSLPPLIAAMMRREFYPERPSDVELRQTHISYVLLAGDYVYKIKKPVRFPFVDYSTLDLRHHFCREEVRLNRRLSPGLYLGVAPILKIAAGFALGAETAAPQQPEAVEWAVKMHRLPEERMLDRLVGAGKAGKEEIRRVAVKLAAFHRTAATGRAAAYGTPAAVWKMLADNFQENERLAGYTVSQRELLAIEDFCRAFVAEHWRLLARRLGEGKIRDGHGDLRCEHVCLTDGIEVFDCIEFSESLRYCDVASEIAFLAMDLERLGAPPLADELARSYAEAADDPELLELLPLYKCHRAAVRGKVESLKSMEPEVPERERARSREAARDYFRLACGYAKRFSPALLIVCGPSGSGKTTVAQKLAAAAGFEVLSSDAVRKQLAGIPPEQSARAPWGEGIYSQDFTERTYNELLVRAKDALQSRKGVIVDATFRDPKHRRMFLGLAAEAGVPIVFVECRVEEKEVLRRLAERERRGGEVSDATAEIYFHQLREFVPLTEIAERSHLLFDRHDGYDKLLAQLEERLHHRP